MGTAETGPSERRDHLVSQLAVRLGSVPIGDEPARSFRSCHHRLPPPILHGLALGGCDLVLRHFLPPLDHRLSVTLSLFKTRIGSAPGMVAPFGRVLGAFLPTRQSSPTGTE